MEIATVRYVPPARRIVTDDPPRPPEPGGSAKPEWRWENPAAVESLLAGLKVRREVLFPEGAPLDPADDFAAGLPDLSYSPGWAVLEVGLSRLPEPLAPTHAARPCHDRDHQFLAWYEDENSGTYRSPAGIRDRWNEAYPRDSEQRVTRDVVVKAIRRARGERDGAAGG